MSDLPEWLLPPSPPDLQPEPRPISSDQPLMTAMLGYPEHDRELAKLEQAGRKKSKGQMELDLIMFDQMFNVFMAQIAGGVPLTTLLRDDHRCIQEGRFMRWINKDPVRRAEYEKAMEAGVELLIHETITIADNTEEDVTRSALRIKTRQQIAAKYKPKLFGDSKQIDITTKNMTREGLQQLTSSELYRLLDQVNEAEDDVIDGEYTDVEVS